MSFLRRLLGRGPGDPSTTSDAVQPGLPAPSEEERDRALLREEAARLDELQQRQLRYAEYAWRPPAQGGVRRADDDEQEGGE